MAISIAQYVDLLFKKLQGVAKTANATVKGASNESIASPAFIRGDVVWTQADQIGNVAGAISGIANAQTGANAVECTADTTVPPIGGVRPTWLTNVPYWISQEFGSTWLPKVFVGPSGEANIEATGTQIFAAGIGGTGEYFFDTQAGVLNFIGETIPTVLSAGNVVYISGYVYSGLLGVTNLPDIEITGNLSATGNITANNFVANTSALIGNITISGTDITSDANISLQSSAGGNIDITPDGSGTVNIDNITIADNTIGTTTGNLVIDPAANIIFTDTLANSILFTGPEKEVLTDANLSFDGTDLVLAGSANIDNIRIDGTDISSNANLTISTANDGNLTFTVNGNGVASFVSTTSLTIPAGNTAQRPASPETGAIRFNTGSTQVEVWDGAQWEVVGSDFVSITNQTINGDGSTDTFVLNQSTTSAAIMVATNGVVQQPDVAYTVTGNSITFAEAPQISDTIDIRFTAAVTYVNAITNLSGNAEITVSGPGVANIATCDSLQLPSYTVADAANIASPAAGQIIYVSDGDSGNPCLAVYSSGAWKRVSLGANIST